jgi:hypothetical protein
MTSCVVVGQSNSVLREGFASFIGSSPNVTMMKRGSLGSSSAILGAYFIQPGFCKGFDYCVIDLVLYDYHVASVSEGSYTGYEISKILEYMIHTIRGDGCQPILMVFSPQWANFSHGWVGDVHKQVAKSNSCFYFDFCEFVTKKLSIDVNNISSAYIDAYHPSSAIQKAMAELLSHFMEANANVPCRTQAVEDFAPRFEVIRLDNVPNTFLRYSRKNSLIEENFVRVSGGQILNLDIGNNKWVRGIVINSTASSGAVSLRGDINVIIKLSGSQFDEDRFVMQVVPVFANIQGLNAHLTISLTNHEETESHVSALSEAGSRKHQLELSALIVERVNRCRVSYETNTVDPASLDIVNGLSYQFR